ncbi:MAG: histidine phosphatase family protein [Pseudomonadota bacterium]
MTSSPKIYFVRHGQTDWNVEYRLQGQKDIPINKKGRTQAKANGEKLKTLLDDPGRHRFIASPLGRTRETMNIIRMELGLPSYGYETDDRLREISFGLWETYTFDELRIDNNAAVDARFEDKWNFKPPQGENYAMLLERVKSWLRYVNEDCVVVCHGGIVRVLMHHLNGASQEDAVQAKVPQDKVFFWDGNSAEWL